MVFRFDTGRLERPTRTPQGGLKAPAFFTRAGVLEYVRTDGTLVREWRPMAEVSNADSLATLAAAPVTKGHSTPEVTRDNYKQHAVGYTGETVKMDGAKAAGTVYLQDEEILVPVEKGQMREISAGYRCRLDETPGVVPEGEPDAGKPYDRVQRGIRYNHVAVLKVGRAGSDVSLRLDAADNALPLVDDGPQPNQEKNMKVERIDGVEYEIGTEPHKAAVLRRDEADKARKAEADKLQARLDAAEADVAKLKKEAAEAPVKFAEQVKARTALETSAKKILGEEVKLDGKDDAAIRLEVARKANPELKLDGKSADYIGALYDRAVAEAASREGDEDLAKVRTDGEGEEVRTDGKAGALSADAAWEQMVERNRNKWKNAPNKAQA